MQLGTSGSDRLKDETKALVGGDSQEFKLPEPTPVPPPPCYTGL